LKSSEGQDRIRVLLADADLLVTSTRPAALRRLGLDWSEISRRYPQLCQVAIIGHRPPDEEKPGHDLTYQAGLGLLDPPRLPRTVLADLAGAERAVAAALALLLGNLRAKMAGETLEAKARIAWVSLAEAAEAFAEPVKYGLTAPSGLLAGAYPGYNIYQAQDGWVAVAALEPHFFQRLVSELGLSETSRAAIAGVFLTRRASEWEAWAADRDLPLVAVQVV
jgi:crotonobetainyl-CoA:carnitine CoA-transferase CaiB-like acyl-CoA transferase